LNYKPGSRISNTYAVWFQDKNLVFQISSTAVANIPKESKISPNVKAHAIHKGTGCLTLEEQTNNSDLVPIIPFLCPSWLLLCYVAFDEAGFFFFFFGVIFCRMQTLDHLLVQGKKLPLLQEEYKPELGEFISKTLHLQ
jgi:hypothetical protein